MMLMVIPGAEVGGHSALMAQVFRLRHVIFAEEKGWDELRKAEGLERDRSTMPMRSIPFVCEMTRSSATSGSCPRRGFGLAQTPAEAG